MQATSTGALTSALGIVTYLEYAPQHSLAGALRAEAPGAESRLKSRSTRERLPRRRGRARIPIVGAEEQREWSSIVLVIVLVLVHVLVTRASTMASGCSPESSRCSARCAGNFAVADRARARARARGCVVDDEVTAGRQGSPVKPDVQEPRPPRWDPSTDGRRCAAARSRLRGGRRFGDRLEIRAAMIRGCGSPSSRAGAPGTPRWSRRVARPC